MTLSDKENPSRQVEPTRSSTVRRRRKRPSLFVRTDERGLFWGNLIHTATPTADYFFLSILAGFILAAAILFDLRALYILAALSAPFMAPLAGLSIATVSGSMRFFIHSLSALLIGSVLVFGMGALSGLAAHVWPSLSQTGTAALTGLNWADVLLLVAGAIFLAVRLYKNPQENPRLASAALAYELYLPAVLAGYGLAVQSPALLQNGLITFAIHVSLACLTAAAVFILLGLRLRLRENKSLSGSIFLIVILFIIILGGYGWMHSETGSVIPNLPAPTTMQTESPSAEPQVQTAAVTETRTLTITSEPAVTKTRTATPEPSLTGTFTITAEPQSYEAVVRVSGSAGIYIREEPAGQVITSVLNGTWLEVLPDHEETEINGAIWVYIRTNNGIEGWVMKSLLDIRASTPLP